MHKYIFEPHRLDMGNQRSFWLGFIWVLLIVKKISDQSSLFTPQMETLTKEVNNLLKMFSFLEVMNELQPFFFFFFYNSSVF